MNLAWKRSFGLCHLKLGDLDLSRRATDMTRGELAQSDRVQLRSRHLPHRGPRRRTRGCDEQRERSEALHGPPRGDTSRGRHVVGRVGLFTWFERWHGAQSMNALRRRAKSAANARARLGQGFCFSVHCRSYILVAARSVARSTSDDHFDRHQRGDDEDFAQKYATPSHVNEPRSRTTSPSVHRQYAVLATGMPSNMRALAARR